jgi:hypothetical protein
MTDPLSTEMAALIAEQQRIRADRGIDRVTKASLIADLEARVARITETRRVQHARRTNKVSPVEQRLREW